MWRSPQVSAALLKLLNDHKGYLGNDVFYQVGKPACPRQAVHYHAQYALTRRAFRRLASCAPSAPPSYLTVAFPPLARRILSDTHIFLCIKFGTVLLTCAVTVAQTRGEEQVLAVFNELFCMVGCCCAPGQTSSARQWFVIVPTDGNGRRALGTGVSRIHRCAS